MSFITQLFLSLFHYQGSSSSSQRQYGLPDANELNPEKSRPSRRALSRKAMSSSDLHHANENREEIVPNRSPVTIMYRRGRTLFKMAYREAFGYIPVEYTFRQTMRHVITVSPFGRAWDAFQMILSVVGCSLYVATTYDIDIPLEADLFLTLFFTVDYIWKLYAASRRWKFMRSFFAIIDVLTCVPFYIEVLQSAIDPGSFSISLSFVRVARILRLIRILRSFKFLSAASKPFPKQLLRMGLVFVSMVFICAGAMNIIESNQPIGLYQVFKPGEVNPRIFSFHNAVYYTVVTIATVGYGDFVPTTPLGKVLAVCTIILAAVIVPLEINALTGVLKSQSKYDISYQIENDQLQEHVVVIGGTNNENVMKNFFDAFFHPDRQEGELFKFKACAVVVLGDAEPTNRLVRVMNSPIYDDKITYIKGSPLSMDDLQRCSLKTANVIFIISDIMDEDSEAADRVSTLRAIVAAIEAPQARLIMHSRTTRGLEAVYRTKASVELLCVQEWKMCLLGQSMMIPGFSTLFANLLRPSESPSNDDLVPPWRLEYSVGASNEIYSIRCPAQFDGSSYSDYARHIYSVSSGEVLCAGVREENLREFTPMYNRRQNHLRRRNRREGNLETVGARQRTLHEGATILNPGPNYRMKEGQVVFVIAQDIRTADRANSARKIDVKHLMPQLPAEGRVNDGYGYLTDEKASNDELDCHLQKKRANKWSWHDSEKAEDAQWYTSFSNNNKNKSVAPSIAPTPEPFTGLNFDSHSGLGTSSSNALPTPSSTHNDDSVHEEDDDLLDAGLTSPSKSIILSSFTSNHESLQAKEKIMAEISFHSVSEIYPPVKDHIIVCSSLKAFQGLLPHLRAFHTRNTSLSKQVILLTHDDDSQDAHASILEIQKFGNAAIILGSSANPDDLVRAGVSDASCLALLSETSNLSTIDGETLDAGVVCNYLILEHVLANVVTQPSFYIVIELLSANNLSVLNSKRMSRLASLKKYQLMKAKSVSKHTDSVGVSLGVNNQVAPLTPLSSATHFFSKQLSVNRMVGGGFESFNPKLFALSCRDDAVNPTGGSGSGPEITTENTNRSYYEVGENYKKSRLIKSNVSTIIEEEIEVPFFMSGYAFPIDLMHTFLCSFYFNPEMIHFASALLRPDPGRGSRLLVEPLPRRFHNVKFGDMWKEMMSMYGVTVIGLYRSRLAAGAPMSYVYMSPPFNTPLYSTDEDEDLLYCLSPQPVFQGQNSIAPDELVGMENIYKTIRTPSGHVLQMEAQMPTQPSIVQKFPVQELKAAPAMPSTPQGPFQLPTLDRQQMNAPPITSSRRRSSKFGKDQSNVVVE